MKYALYSQRVVLPEGIKEATIFVEEAFIVDVVMGRKSRDGYEFEDCGGDVIMPGLIDAHVHINEPGRTQWEGFDTATKAAAAGGITTLIDMPLNSSPVTTTVQAFDLKLNAAKSRIHVNCGFWGGVVPENCGDIESILRTGVLGLKAFLAHSGIDDFANVDESELRMVLPLLKKYNLPLLVHCEIESPHSDLHLLQDLPTEYNSFLKSRPRSWEDKAIELMISLCKEYDFRTHIVHLSSSSSLKAIQDAKNLKIPLTVETCPHYLFFSAESIPDGATEFKCAPPIREKENNEQLWEAVQAGLIDFIVTDHSPAPPNLKELESGNFANAWGGISSLQFSLPAVWTQAKEKGFSIEDIWRLMSYNVAMFLGIETRQGSIAKNYFADLLVWKPEEQITIRADMIQHKHKITPYMGRTLFGVVKKTFVSGYKVYDNGKFNELNKGQILLK